VWKSGVCVLRCRKQWYLEAWKWLFQHNYFFCIAHTSPCCNLECRNDITIIAYIFIQLHNTFPFLSILFTKCLKKKFKINIDANFLVQKQGFSQILSLSYWLKSQKVSWKPATDSCLHYVCKAECSALCHDKWLWKFWAVWNVKNSKTLHTLHFLFNSQKQ